MIKKWIGLVWFGSFVQWHINLLGLFNAKSILLEGHIWYYLTYRWEDKGVHTFPKGICLKVNVTAWLEFELTTILQPIALTITPQGYSQEKWKNRWRITWDNHSLITTSQELTFITFGAKWVQIASAGVWTHFTFSVL